MKKIITFCALFVWASLAKAGTIKLSQSDICISTKPVLLFTAVGIASNLQFYWQYSDRTEDSLGLYPRWHIFDSIKTSVTINSIPGSERRFRVVAGNGISISERSNQILVCKCGVLALGDLTISVTSKNLTFGGTTSELYDHVYLMKSYDKEQKEWKQIEDVTARHTFDLSSIKTSAYFRLDGYNRGQKIRSSYEQFVPKIKYQKPLSGYITTTNGQQIGNFTGVSVRDDTELIRTVLKGYPMQTYFIVVTQDNIMYSVVGVAGSK